MYQILFSVLMKINKQKE